MYTAHFGLSQEPFSIAPDPSFLFLSEAHNEALAHLMYGFSHGGFVLITGEVGTGKTTLLRNIIDRTPPDLDVAFVLNPRLTVRELLETLCDELGIAYDAQTTHSVKHYIDVLNRHLLRTHQSGRSTVVIIDEAQNLSPDVLEQIRLLTNLETNEKKLLRIILLGQPELADLLARQDLRQLAQRITARYHLTPLKKDDVRHYVNHRLTRAGGSPLLFSDSAIGALYRVSKGTPRLINIIADRALLGAYVEGNSQVNARSVYRAADEVLDNREQQKRYWLMMGGALLVGISAVLWALLYDSNPPVVENNNNGAITNNTPVSEAVPATVATDNRPQDIAVSTPSRSLVTRPDGNTSNQQRKAYRSIFALWGADYPLDAPQIPCDYAPTAGLQCLGRNGDWSEIAQLNLPVVLELWDNQSTPFHAGLLAINGDTFELHVGDQVIQADRRSLRDTWFGAYVILWPTPPFYAGSIKEGDNHPSASWLRNQLADLGWGQNGSGTLFDAELAANVRSFQAQQNLISDGIVGPLTWISLNNQLGLPGPRLTQATPN